MKNSNPISLFSFQDIITCLTGIMIVIVLVILLQLVDALVKMTAKSELAPIYKERKLERDLLKAREKELEDHIKKLAEENKKIKNASADDLAKNSKREQVYFKYLSETLRKTEEELKKIREEQSRLAEQLKSALKKENELKKEELSLAQIKAEIEELKKKEVQIRQEYEKKKKIIKYTFSGMNDRSPILIECCNWGFRTKVFPDGQTHVFGEVNKTKLGDQLVPFAKYVGSLDKGSVYLVIFFRKDTIRYMPEICNPLEEHEYKIGKEILEKWENGIHE